MRNGVEMGRLLFDPRAHHRHLHRTGFSRPLSEAVRNVWTIMSPYLYATNLNHGYHSSRTEPGGQHLG